MPHINTKPGQHDNTVSAYIIKQDDKTTKLILHKHKIINKLLQFGGHVEINENPWQAITREILEETGYELSQLRILQPKSRIKSLPNVKMHPVPVNFITHGFDDTEHLHTDIAFAFITNEEPKNKIADNESNKISRFDVDELEQINPNDIFENIRNIGIFVLTEVMQEWEQIPATDFN